MRVIAGTYRSRQLVAPRGLQTRPTSDRLRERLFDILSPRVSGCRFVDLYAGTGAVGIEALSRGATHVWFAENAEPALASIRQNLAALKIVSGFTVEDRGVGAMLQRLGKISQLIDLVYIDPPYEAEAEYAATLNFLGSARGRATLAPNALVIAEHSSKATLAMRYGALEHTRLVKQGDAALSFFAFPAADQNPHLDEDL
jgi:16S rRNA (guanine966-N2)-methyltransferase